MTISSYVSSEVSDKERILNSSMISEKLAPNAIWLYKIEEIYSQKKGGERFDQNKIEVNYHKSRNLSTISGAPSLKSSTMISPFDVFRIYRRDEKHVRDCLAFTTENELHNAISSKIYCKCLNEVFK